MANGLLIVDVQNGFVHGDAKKVSQKIADLSLNYRFDYMIASQFYNHAGSPFDDILNESMMSTTQSQMLDLAVRRQRLNLITKHDTYSAFTKELQEFIEQKKIDRLYIVGANTESSIMATVFDCFNYNMDFRLLTDMCASVNNDMHEAAVKILTQVFGAKTINVSNKILSHGNVRYGQ